MNSKTEELSIPCIYEEAFSFDLSSCNTVVKLDGKYGIIDKEGNCITGFIFDKCYSTIYPYYNAHKGEDKYRIYKDGTYEKVDN